jgi:hypothetical protein
VSLGRAIRGVPRSESWAYDASEDNVTQRGAFFWGFGITFLVTEIMGEGPGMPLIYGLVIGTGCMAIAGMIFNARL